MSQFPLIVKAVRSKKDWDRPWLIGDAALAECGAKGAAAMRLLALAAQELQALGFTDMKLSTLDYYRRISHYYKPDQRRRDCSWVVHRAARSPGMLDAIIARNGGPPKNEDEVQRLKEQIIAERGPIPRERKTPIRNVRSMPQLTREQMGRPSIEMASQQAEDMPDGWTNDMVYTMRHGQVQMQTVEQRQAAEDRHHFAMLKTALRMMTTWLPSTFERLQQSPQHRFDLVTQLKKIKTELDALLLRIDQDQP